MDIVGKVLAAKTGGFALSGLSSSNSFSRFIILIAIISLVAFIIDFLLSRTFLGRSYRVFVAPGVILHEVSHAVLCLVTGARITKIAFFDKDGGKVEHGSPKLPFVGQILISMAPFAVGAVAIYFLSRKLGLESIDVADLSHSPGILIGYFKENLARLNLHDIKTWVVLYLVLSIAVTMTPSSVDFKNIGWSLLIILAAIILVYKFTAFRLGTIPIPEAVIAVMATTFALLILGLFLSIIFYVLTKLFIRGV